MDHHRKCKLSLRWLCTDCGGIKLASATRRLYVQGIGNDGRVVSSAIRFRGTPGSPKEATGNGRTVDRVICESLPEDIYERDFLSRPLYPLNGRDTAGNRAPVGVLVAEEEAIRRG